MPICIRNRNATSPGAGIAELKCSSSNQPRYAVGEIDEAEFDRRMAVLDR